MVQRCFIRQTVGIVSAVLGLGPLVLSSCGGGSTPKETAGAVDPARGRRVYMAVCIACHNPDPSKDGPIGPAVEGASEELLKTRILEGRYPPGYTPKRKTALMPKQPQLAEDIPHLAAFLNP